LNLGSNYWQWMLVFVAVFGSILGFNYFVFFGKSQGCCKKKCKASKATKGRIPLELE